MEDGTRVTIATLTDKGMEYTENLMYTQAAEQNFNLVGDYRCIRIHFSNQLMNYQMII